MKIITKIITILIFANFLFLTTPQVSLAGNFFEVGGGLTEAATLAGYDGKDKDPMQKIIAAVKFVLSFLGVLFLILMIYGGYTWMMAAGNDEQIKKARDIIKAAVIGLIIVAAAYGISAFIGGAIVNPATGTQ